MRRGDEKHRARQQIPGGRIACGAGSRRVRARVLGDRVFLFDRVLEHRVLRFPGAVLLSPQPTAFNAGLTVGVPQVVERIYARMRSTSCAGASLIWV